MCNRVFMYVDTKNCVCAMPAVYRWCIQNTTECGLFKESKGMHVTLSGVCVLDYILTNFVMTNCRFVVWLLNEFLYIYRNFSRAFIKFTLLTTCINSMTSSLGPMECRFSWWRCENFEFLLWCVQQRKCG